MSIRLYVYMMNMIAVERWVLACEYKKHMDQSSVSSEKVYILCMFLGPQDEKGVFLWPLRFAKLFCSL